jgi:hypothetical protein
MAHKRTTRHVRFTDTHAYYSPPPSRSPSPPTTLRLPLVPSGPSSNPSLSVITNLGVAVNLDAFVHAVVLNPILAYDKEPANSLSSTLDTSPPLNFDVSRPVESVTLNPGVPETSRIGKMATFPSLYAMSIVNDLLPYPIRVRAAMLKQLPSPVSPTAQTMDVELDHGAALADAKTDRLRTNDTAVTVLDVLHALHCFLQIPLTHGELFTFSQARRTELLAAFEARVGSLTNADDRVAQRKQGPRRLDLLRGETRFLGLSPTQDTAVWVMHSQSPL